MKLSTRIMAALVLGVVAGLLLGADGAEFAKTWIAPFGAIFMNMIKMTIVPMVFASLVMGMCSLGDIKKNPPYRYENRYLLPCNNSLCHCAWPYFGQCN